MRSFLFVVCFLFGCAAPGAAVGKYVDAIIWADGVSAAGGWKDVDKSAADPGDDLMCYAASAANLIAWWQERSGLVSSAPTKLEDIWGEYVSHRQNGHMGGDPVAALNWWFSGVYAPTNDAEAARSLFNKVSPGADVITLQPFKGFYFDQYGLDKEMLSSLFSYSDVLENDYLGDLLSAGAGVSLLLQPEGNSMMHAITLWGAEYNEAGYLSKLWVTDSDDADEEDAFQELFSIDVVRDAESDRVYFDMSQGSEIGYYEWQKLLGREIYIYGVNAIHLSATADWRLVIPEPGTVSLCLLACCGLAFRRRR